ncbi:MAG TPA: methyltransferase [Kofleriaceae bacterium]|jgi:acetylserotonin N-methyltransferase
MHYEAPPTDDRPLWDIWLSVHRLQVLTTAYEVGIFDTLAAGPCTAEQLAEQRGFELRGTRAVLAMLAALELVRVSATGYELTTVARTYLVSTSAFDWGPLLRSRIAIIPELHRDLVQVLTATREMPAAAQGWADGEMPPELAARVTRIMHCHSLAAAITLAPKLAGVKRMLDVGGGSGVFSIAAAQRNTELHATVMDLAAVCDLARQYIDDGGVTGRVTAQAVDMFRGVWPTHYDAVLFSNVFHDWGTETNTQLARSAFGALSSGGSILLHEMLLDENGGPATTAGFSIRMVTSNEGRQYTLAELRDILESAGFRDVRATSAHLYYSLVTATKP